MMSIVLGWLACLAVALLAAAAAEQEPLDFNAEIRPVLSRNCFFCHGPDAHERKADLRLDSYEGATEDRDGAIAIDPADLAGSDFIARITTLDEDDLMPPPDSHKALTSAEIDLLSRWVKAGARYEEHWAFVPPAVTPMPSSSEKEANPIDSFIRARSGEAQLAPSPEATPQQLIRRVSFDLTGLPPTPARVVAFVRAHEADPEKAYGELVDELFASEHYGERMALAWMDAARYGDTSVMHADGPRDMWLWRDWVIDAYNDNKPFSDFLREQLAGDLIPGATRDQKIATGFNRNNATSDEGGAFPEELRVEYTLDRLATTSNVFLGLSVECAQCHDHKYDPISQKEFYGLYAFFNVAADPGMQTRKGNVAPLVEYTIGGDQERAAVIDGKVQEINGQLAAHKQAATEVFSQWASTTAPDDLDFPEPPGLAHHFPLDLEDGGVGLTDVISGATTTAFGMHPPEPFPRYEMPAVRFTGIEPVVVSGPGQPHLDVAKPFSLSYWIRPENETVTGAVAARMNPQQKFRGWDVWLEDGRPGIHLIDAWPDNALKVVAGPALPVNRWNHVVLTYDGSRKAKGVGIYVNGEKVSVATAMDTLKPDSNNSPSTDFHFGARLGKQSKTVFALDEFRIYDRALPQGQVGQLNNGSVILALNTPAEKRSEAQAAALNAHYFTNIDPESMAFHQQLGRLHAERAEAMKGSSKVSTMVMGDLPPDKTRLTYLLNRGQYDAPKEDEVIPAGVPAVFPPLPDGAPANRLGLAEWLLRDDHPLTARVAVNRYWAMLLGRGIVPTVTDFGNQGATPSHAALLDWLATDFRENGWDIKRTLRQIVTSATYRQSSVISEQHLAADPENILLARSPRFRLQGEFIRDAALAVSGLLVHELGGPSTKPYQPPGLWKEVALANAVEFQQDHGDALYRRSMYIYWKRSAAHPAITIFDAPSREKCVVQRARTNTPLQALVTLNDVQFVEAARKLAARVLVDPKEATFEDRVAQLYELCTARTPEPDEIEVCREVYDGHLADFQKNLPDAESFLAHGESPLTEGLDTAEHASWAVLASMMLNLDETLTRE